MASRDSPWDHSHHRSSLATCSRGLILDEPQSSLYILSEGNLGVISPTIPIDISIKPGIIEQIYIGVSCSDEKIGTLTSLFKEFHDIFAWSYKDMSVMNPSIIIHEIKTYTNVKLVLKKLHLIHPCKVTAIKYEVDKLMKASFIYPVPLTEWVLNIVLVTKKHGTIRVCVDYRDINKYCPKDNYPTPFIDHIIDDCVGSEVFSFMDGFSCYNQINILPVDQHKTAFIFLWGTFAYRKLPFGLKNVGVTFQRVMSYAFHDIKHIVQPYLDNLPAHSTFRRDHPVHLRIIFYHFRYYKICLNPHNCVFCIEFRCFLGFIVSKEGIHLDPLKVQEILDLLHLSSLHQLQSLQGKANFLR